MDDRPTFEETYPKYESSELVRLGLALGVWLRRMLRRAKASRPTLPPVPAARNEFHAD